MTVQSLFNMEAAVQRQTADEKGEYYQVGWGGWKAQSSESSQKVASEGETPMNLDEINGRHWTATTVC